MAKHIKRYDKAYLAELLAQPSSTILAVYKMSADEFPLRAVEAIHDEACRRLQFARTRENLELELLTNSYL